MDPSLQNLMQLYWNYKAGLSLANLKDQMWTDGIGVEGHLLQTTMSFALANIFKISMAKSTKIIQMLQMLTTNKAMMARYSHPGLLRQTRRAGSRLPFVMLVLYPFKRQALTSHMSLTWHYCTMEIDATSRDYLLPCLAGSSWKNCEPAFRPLFYIPRAVWRRFNYLKKKKKKDKKLPL